MSQNKHEDKALSRRDFIRKTAVGMGTTAMVGLSARSAGSQELGPAPKWENETDVLIVGTGFAGLASAITAHDAGAKVLILEKAPKLTEA